MPKNRSLNRLALQDGWLKQTVVPGVGRRAIISGLRRLNRRYNLVRPQPVDRELRRRLTEDFRDDILQLQDLIGRDLSHWLRSEQAR